MPLPAPSGDRRRRSPRRPPATQAGFSASRLHVERTGGYPIERREGEIERLRIQAAALEFDAGVMLDSGRVIGLDSDAVFLESARVLARSHALDNVEFVLGDAYRTQLPPRSFDLVHARFVASTAGQPEELIAEAVALARPGGFVAFQEPDVGTLKCYPPHPAWDRLARLCEQVFERAGGDVRLAERLYSMARVAE